MQVAYLLYDGFTALDVTGPYEVLSSVPGTESVLVAERPGPVRNDRRTLEIVADRSLDEVRSPDVVVVPGGFGTRRWAGARAAARLAAQRARDDTFTTSVCTGSLLLAAAGLLAGAPAPPIVEAEALR